MRSKKEKGGKSKAKSERKKERAEAVVPLWIALALFCCRVRTRPLSAVVVHRGKAQEETQSRGSQLRTQCTKHESKEVWGSHLPHLLCSACAFHLIWTCLRSDWLFDSGTETCRGAPRPLLMHLQRHAGTMGHRYRRNREVCRLQQPIQNSVLARGPTVCLLRNSGAHTPYVVAIEAIPPDIRDRFTRDISRVLSSSQSRAFRRIWKHDAGMTHSGAALQVCLVLVAWLLLPPLSAPRHFLDFFNSSSHNSTSPLFDIAAGSATSPIESEFYPDDTYGRCRQHSTNTSPRPCRPPRNPSRQHGRSSLAAASRGAERNDSAFSLHSLR